LVVLLDPPPESRPLLEQRLVHELDRALTRYDETTLNQDVEHSRRALVGEIKIRSRHPPARQRLAHSSTDKAEKDPTGRALLFHGERPVRGLGVALDDAANPTDPPVRVERQPRALPLSPQVEECGRKKGKRSRLARHVVDELIDQLLLDLEA